MAENAFSRRSFTCVCVCVCLCKNIHTHTHTNTYTYTHTHTHTHARVLAWTGWTVDSNASSVLNSNIRHAFSKVNLQCFHIADILLLPHYPTTILYYISYYNRLRARVLEAHILKSYGTVVSYRRYARALTYENSKPGQMQEEEEQEQKQGQEEEVSAVEGEEPAMVGLACRR